MNLKQEFAKLPIVFQFALLAFSFVLLISILVFLALRPRIREMRSIVTIMLARVTQVESNRSVDTFNTLLPKLGIAAKSAGIEMWIVSANGTVLSSTFQRPLPIDWSLVTKPEEELAPTWQPPIQSLIDNFCIVRLLTGEPKFLVLFFHREGSYFAAIVFFILNLVVATILGLCCIVWFLTRDLLPNKFPPGTIPREGQAGFSLITGLITLTILSMTILAMQAALTGVFKGSSHADLAQGVRSLSDTLKDSIDCGKTMENIVVGLDCAPNTLKAIELRNKQGGLVTGTLNSAPRGFSPTSPDFQGAGKLGNWHLRAYCEGSDGILKIRYARAGTPPETFHKDPLTKRPYDWTDGNSNPLFGTADRLICQKTGTGTGTPTAPLGYLASRALYKDQELPTGTLQVDNVPPETKLIKMYAQGTNYFDGSTNDNLLSEDFVYFNITADLTRQKSTGYFGVTAGTSRAYVAHFSWQDQDFSGVTQIQGWFTPSDPYVLAASLFRPSFRYDASAKTFTLLQMPRYYPAGYVFMFDFYGQL